MNFIIRFFVSIICMFSVTVLTSENCFADNLTGISANYMLANVEKSIWISDGKASDKQIYVFFQPGCPRSKRLYEASKKFTNKAQFRWIPIMPGASNGWVEWIIEKRTTTALSQAFTQYYKGELAPPSDFDKTRMMLIYNDACFDSSVVNQKILLPWIVYKTQHGVHVTSYPETALENIASRVVSRPNAINSISSAMQIIGKSFNKTHAKNKFCYTGVSDKQIPLYIYPDKLAPVKSYLKSDEIMYPSGFIANEWVVFTVNSEINGEFDVYIYDPKFAELSLMGFEVTPASVVVDGPVKIYSHPSLNSNVISDVSGNKCIKVTGRLKNMPWYQIDVKGSIVGYVPASSDSLGWLKGVASKVLFNR